MLFCGQPNLGKKKNQNITSKTANYIIETKIIHKHTRLGSRRCSASQRPIQELVCAGGTGPCHQPGCSFMKEQLERSGRTGHEQEQEEGWQQVMMSHTVLYSSTSARLWILVNNGAKHLPWGVCVSALQHLLANSHRNLYSELPANMCTACRLCYISICQVSSWKFILCQQNH